MALFYEVRNIVSGVLCVKESEIKPVPPVIKAFIGKIVR